MFLKCSVLILVRVDKATQSRADIRLAQSAEIATVCMGCARVAAAGQPIAGTRREQWR